jgi:hypothetical protein
VPRGSRHVHGAHTLRRDTHAPSRDTHASNAGRGPVRRRCEVSRRAAVKRHRRATHTLRDVKELRVHTRCEYTHAARCEGVASTHTLRGVTHRHTTHTLRLALLHRHPSLLRAKSEWSERITHAEKEASAASELCTRRKQVSESHTRRKKRAQRAKHTLETEASESHTRRKKRANHTDEKRGRRETQTPIVYSEH